MTTVINKSTLFFLFLGPILHSGCMEDYSSYCNDIVECQGGNQDDLERCINEWESEANRASTKDCRDAFDDYFSCRASNSTCADQRWTDNEQCDDADRKWRRC